eukprot:COSAG02_NODE_690_length_18450_cov_6.643017_2_plen_190_part_00
MIYTISPTGVALAASCAPCRSLALNELPRPFTRPMMSSGGCFSLNVAMHNSCLPQTFGSRCQGELPGAVLKVESRFHLGLTPSVNPLSSSPAGDTVSVTPYCWCAVMAEYCAWPMSSCLEASLANAGKEKPKNKDSVLFAPFDSFLLSRKRIHFSVAQNSLQFGRGRTAVGCHLAAVAKLEGERCHQRL